MTALLVRQRPSLRSAASVAAKAGSASARQTAANRGELFVTGFFYLIVTTVLSQMWATAAEGSGGNIVGYSATALVWYIATTEVAVSSIPVRLIEDIGDDIVSRRIEVELLRPASTLAVRVATQVGRVMPRLALSAVLGLGFASVVAGRPPSLAALALAVPALLLAVVTNVVIQHGFAAGAFWVGETKSGWFLYQKLVFVLGGMLLPLEVLPPGVEVVAKMLPFAAVAYVPGRLAAGHFEPWWLAVQLGWLVVTGAVVSLGFRAGLHRMRETGA